VKQPYDPTLKTLVETSPADWLSLLGLPRKRASVEDTDLATLVSGAVDKVLRVHAQLKERLSHERRRQRVRDLWAATYVLLGLRYSDAFANLLFQEVLGMEESTTYQAIIQKGRLTEVRQILLRQGRKLFGPPEEATTAALNAIADVQKLEDLTERILDVGSWEELLARPSRRRRGNGQQRAST
jgi:hypothetical protein